MSEDVVIQLQQQAAILADRIAHRQENLQMLSSFPDLSHGLKPWEDGLAGLRQYEDQAAAVTADAERHLTEVETALTRLLNEAEETLRTLKGFVG